MDQKPIYDGSFISGVIVNDINYLPASELPLDRPFEREPCSEEKDMDFKSICACLDKSEEVSLGACDIFKEFTVHNVHIHSEGRLLKVKVQLKDVCPGRKIRLAVLLFEKECREEELKGLRTAEIKAPCGPCGCIDELTVGDFCFVVSDDQLCSRKEAKIEVIAHYSSFPRDCHPG